MKICPLCGSRSDGSFPLHVTTQKAYRRYIEHLRRRLDGAQAEARRAREGERFYREKYFALMFPGRIASVSINGVPLPDPDAGKSDEEIAKGVAW